VLVAVIALLALSGALIAGAFAAARGTARATRSARAAIVAQAAARRALARTIVTWSAADDSLRIDVELGLLMSAMSGTIKSEIIVVGPDNALQNVFLYVKDGLGNRTFVAPKTPVVLDQSGCKYLPHVFGKDAAVRVHEHRGGRDVAGGG